MAFVRILAMRNKPLADRHLRHYLKGNGRPMALDSDCLFTDDSGVRNEFLSQVAERIRGGNWFGVIGIPQSAFADRDWLFALGGINVSWCVEGSFVKALPTTEYDWHPDQPRITQGIHRIATRLKSKGARDFRIIGSPLLIPMELVRKASSPQGHDRSVLNLL